MRNGVPHGAAERLDSLDAWIESKASRIRPVVSKLSVWRLGQLFSAAATEAERLHAPCWPHSVAPIHCHLRTSALIREGARAVLPGRDTSPRKQPALAPHNHSSFEKPLHSRDRRRGRMVAGMLAAVNSCPGDRLSVNASELCCKLEDSSTIRAFQRISVVHRRPTPFSLSTVRIPRSTMEIALHLRGRLERVRDTSWVQDGVGCHYQRFLRTGSGGEHIRRKAWIVRAAHRAAVFGLCTSSYVYCRTCTSLCSRAGKAEADAQGECRCSNSRHQGARPCPRSRATKTFSWFGGRLGVWLLAKGSRVV